MRSTTTTLQLPVVSVQSLLDTAGSALAAPHLHPDAVAMLLSLAGQSPRNTHFALEFTVPPQDTGRLEEVREAVEAQFTRTQEDAARHLRQIMRNGRVAAVVGLLFMAVLLGSVQAVLLLTDSHIVKAVSESLMIVAWVAVWRPAELLLYEHWPVRRQRALAGQLARADVTLIARTAADIAADEDALDCRITDVESGSVHDAATAPHG